MPFIRALGSLKFAIFLIATLAAILIISTTVESIHGTPIAQKVFYNSRWFDIFLAFIWVNIFCSTLTRWPFQRKHTGFVITHIGILTLLIGSLLSRITGVEGQMTLFEEEHKNRMPQNGHTLSVGLGGKKIQSVDLNAVKKLPREIPLKEAHFRLFVTQVLKDAEEIKDIKEGGEKDPVNRAVQATLSGQTMGVHETFWLVQNDPDDPHAFFKDIGPAHFKLESNDKASAAKLVVTQKNTGKSFTMPIDQNSAAEIPIDNSGLVIRNLKYYPNAKIDGETLANSPADVPFNPAVQFEVRDAEGNIEHHTKFFIFPHFNSLRGGEKADLFHLSLRLEAAVPEGADDAGGPSFIFRPAADGRWTYRILSSRKPPQDGELQLKKPISTGWMDMTVEVNQIINRAKVSKNVRPAGAEGEENYAVEILARGKDGSEHKEWLLAGKALQISMGNQNYELALEPKSLALPFMLRLNDFRKIDYPGTQNPASFESDVVLYDPKANLTLERTIKMNRPLDYKGFRVFQSSYIQDPEAGEGSVFTIAKNPGILFIYSGAVTILIGVILLFYLHPFFNKSLKEPKEIPTAHENKVTK